MDRSIPLIRPTFQRIGLLLIGCGASVSLSAQEKWSEPQMREWRDSQMKSFDKHGIGSKRLQEFFLEIDEDQEWQFGDLDVQIAQKGLFPTHFTYHYGGVQRPIEGTSTPIKFAHLNNARPTVAPDPDKEEVRGLVFHYGLDARDVDHPTFVLAVSAVVMRLSDDANGPSSLDFSYANSSFYLVKGDELAPPKPGEIQNVTEWRAGPGAAYLKRVRVERIDNGGSAKWEELVEHLDAESNVFVWKQMNDLYDHNPGATHIVVTCTGVHGLNHEKKGTDYRHGLILHAQDRDLPTPKDLLEKYGVGDGPPSAILRNRACDLGNLCPPKCFTAAPYPAR